MKKGVDYIGVGVGAVIVRNHTLFLSKRGKESRNERGLWEFPGGSVRFGETLEDAIVREMHEEYGITVRVTKLLGVCSHILPHEHQHWVSPTYICGITKGEPVIKEPRKCDEIGWFTLQEMKNLPLSVITTHDVKLLTKAFPEGI